MRSEEKKEAAILWDESFLWGVMAYKALEAGGLSFDLIRSGDIKAGRLKNFSLLFVPGGWASNKIKALGESGVEEIKRFVRDGGSYLGFCGGAGLATLDGIGLLPVKRRPTKDRVPSFSGPIALNVSDHPIWNGISETIFHAWWPSQFIVDGGVSVLATYSKAMPGSFSSDINVGDVDSAGGWTELERAYEINLDPKRLINEPAVIEGRFGKGKVLLSLVHFDTPYDKNGAKALKAVWRYLGGECGTDDAVCRIQDKSAGPRIGHHGSNPNSALSEIEFAVDDLISLGERNFLWFWRNPMLIQWRRGVRGLEYCTLYVLVKEISLLTEARAGEEASGKEENIRRVRDSVLSFISKARHLLVRERHALQKASITYDRCDDTEIQSLREELFSRSKSHGGLFKDIIDDLDRLLYSLMLEQSGAGEEGGRE